jgi:hypothetical protein
VAHDPLPAREGEEEAPEAEKGPGGDHELRPHPLAHLHVDHLGPPGPQGLHDAPKAVLGGLHHQELVGLEDLFEEDPGLAHAELVAFPAHGLQEDGQVELSPAP